MSYCLICVHDRQLKIWIKALRGIYSQIRLYCPHTKANEVIQIIFQTI